MTVKIPLEVSTSGVEDVKKISEEIDKVKENINEIITNTESSESSESSSSESSSTTNSSTGKKSGTKNSKESKTKIDKVLENDLGFSKAKNILNYGTNPSGAILQQLLKAGALPAALIGVPIITAKVIEGLQQEGQFLDRFFDDRIDTRTDALRDKTTQQRILQGFDALRISTIDGNFDPRNVYNSFEVFENDRKLLENDFKIRKIIA